MVYKTVFILLTITFSFFKKTFETNAFYYSWFALQVGNTLLTFITKKQYCNSL